MTSWDGRVAIPTERLRDGGGEASGAEDHVAVTSADSEIFCSNIATLKRSDEAAVLLEQLVTEGPACTLLLVQSSNDTLSSSPPVK